MISTSVHNKGKFINEFMFCATELSELFTEISIWSNLVWNTRHDDSSFPIPDDKYIFFPDETTRLSLL